MRISELSLKIRSAGFVAKCESPSRSPLERVSAWSSRRRRQGVWFRCPGLPHTTSHDLRHTYASWLLAAGESVVTVAARLGHRNASMVIATYGHLVPGTEDRTRRAMDLAWKSARDVPTASDAAR